MKTKFINFLVSMRAKFWFVPALMVITATLIAFNFDTTIDRTPSVDSFRFYGFTYSISSEGTRSILATTAESMIALAGDIFLVTIVVLNLNSSQLVPHLFGISWETTGRYTARQI